MIKLFDFVILFSYLLKIGISIRALASGQQASLLCPSHSTTSPSCFRGPWRYSSYLHQLVEKENGGSPGWTATLSKS